MTIWSEQSAPQFAVQLLPVTAVPVHVSSLVRPPLNVTSLPETVPVASKAGSFGYIAVAQAIAMLQPVCVTEHAPYAQQPVGFHVPATVAQLPSPPPLEEHAPAPIATARAGATIHTRTIIPMANLSLTRRCPEQQSQLASRCRTSSHQTL
jgi:hypothetical protein